MEVLQYSRNAQSQAFQTISLYQETVQAILSINLQNPFGMNPMSFLHAFAWIFYKQPFLNQTWIEFIKQAWKQLENFDGKDIMPYF